MRYLSILSVLMLLAITTQAGNAYIENKGQIIDQNRMPNTAVLYLYNSKGLNVQLRKTGFSYDVWKHNTDSTSTYNRIDIDFVGAASTMRVIADGMSADYLNYSEEKISQVHHYGSVTYKNVWKNIDVQFVLSGYKAKYNFIIHQGGKLADIKLDIKGTNSITEKMGNLVLGINLADLEETVPHSYYSYKEQKTSVHAGFVKNSDGTYGFSVAENIPANAKLVVDPIPTLQWSTYYGGPGFEEFQNGSFVDKYGNIYVGGFTYSATQIATSGAYQQTLPPGFAGAGFLAKFNSDGQIRWSTYYHYTMIGAITTSNNGQYVYGCADKLSKFDSAGNFIWNVALSNVWAALGIVTDSLDNVFITGHVISGSTEATAGAYKTTVGGTADGFISKYSSSGTKLWATFFGGADHDELLTIAVSHGKIYTGGRTSSTSGVTTAGALYPTFPSTGSTAGCMQEWDYATGNLLYATYMQQSCSSLVVDPLGYVYASGVALSSHYATPGAFQTEINSTDAYITKFNPDHSVNFCTFIGGSNTELAPRIELDSNGYIFIAGSTRSGDSIASANGMKTTFGNYGQEMFAIKLSNDGKRQVWGTYFGSNINGIVPQVRLRNSHEFYIVGSINNGPGYSPGNISTPGAYQTTPGGDVDCYIVKFQHCPYGLAIVGGDTASWEGTPVHLTASGGHTYIWTGPGGFTSNQQNPTDSFPDQGYYNVTVIDTITGCSETKSWFVKMHGNINDISATGSFSLYPNPNNGLAQIDLNLKQQQKLSVAITDIAGRTIYTTDEKSYSTGKGKIELDVSALPAGTYVCRLINENGHIVWSGKTVKE